jgi:ribosomal protein L20A (L18A)
MNETKRDIYNSFLSDLIEFEKTLNDQNIELFSRWKEEVYNSLGPRHKIRFARIRFFEETESSDIPF